MTELHVVRPLCHGNITSATGNTVMQQTMIAADPEPGTHRQGGKGLLALSHGCEENIQWACAGN